MCVCVCIGGPESHVAQAGTEFYVLPELQTDDGCHIASLSPLQEEEVLLTVKPSLQP